jgi:hypothetical protein
MWEMTNSETIMTKEARSPNKHLAGPLVVGSLGNSLVIRILKLVIPRSVMGLPFAAAGVFSPAMARSRSSNG